MTRSRRRCQGAAPRAALLAGCLALAGCAGSMAGPDLRSIYAEAATIQGPERLPLVMVPGVLGSSLVDTESGVAVWGGRGGLSPDPDVAFARIALPVGDGTLPNRTLRDGVRPAGVLNRVYPAVLGVPVEVEVYGRLRETVRLGGWISHEDPLVITPDNQTFAPPIPPPDANSFPFAYDWRRDLIDAVRALDAHVRAKAEQVALRAALTWNHREPVRFNLLAHSMGALVARYWLMYGTQDLPEDGSLPRLTWEGAKLIRNAVLVAPPNAGSILAFENLVNGKVLGPLQPVYSAALVGTFFSTYALMPRDRHGRVRMADTGEPPGSLYDPALWVRMGWGLASPKAAEDLARWMPDVPDPAERRRRALAFQAEALDRARRFQAALDRPVDSLPEGLNLYLVVGGAHPTPASASVDPATGAIAIDRWEEGDGVVLRASSLLDERQGRPYVLGLETPLKWSSVLFLPEEHVALTQSAVFGDNLLFWLIEGQRVYPAPVLAPVPAPVIRDADR